MGSRRAAPIVDFSRKWAGLGVSRLTPWHWQTRVYGRVLEIWPGKQKWKFGDETEEGPLSDLEAALRSARQIEAKHRKERGQ